MFFSYEGVNTHIVLDLITGYSWKYVTVALLRSSLLFRFFILHLVIKTHNDVLRRDCTCHKDQDFILSIFLWKTQCYKLCLNLRTVLEVGRRCSLLLCSYRESTWKGIEKNQVIYKNNKNRLLANQDLHWIIELWYHYGWKRASSPMIHLLPVLPTKPYL